MPLNNISIVHHHQATRRTNRYRSSEIYSSPDYLCAALIHDGGTNFLNIDYERCWESRVEDGWCLGAVEMASREVVKLSALGKGVVDSRISSPKFGGFI
jgi:hypothetical protein